MKTIIAFLLLMISSVICAQPIAVKKDISPDYKTLAKSSWKVKNSWNLDNCGFLIYGCYKGESVSNLIEADTKNGLATSWGFMTVLPEEDIDKYIKTNKPIAVYGMIPDIINNWVNGNTEKNRYLDYIEKNVKSGYSIGVCEWENSFYRWFADSTETKATYGYSHEEMSKMTKDQIYEVLRSNLLRWKKDARNKMMMANGFGLIGHLSGDVGAELVGIETSENIPETQFKRAITRGTARQFGIPWFEEVSAWYGPQVTTGYPEAINWPFLAGVKYGGNAGHSMSHMKRIWYSSWFSGSGHIMQEASAQVFYENPWSDPEFVPKNPKLSRFGIEAQKASKLWRTFDRGIPYTPFLIIMGKSAGRWTKVEKPFGILEPNEADKMIHKFIDQLYIDQSLGIGSEERYLCASPYGDTFDVMINDAKRDSWYSYPVIFAMGEIFWTKDDASALKNYVKKGGILVVNELNAKGLESVFADGKNISVSDLLIDKYSVLQDTGKVILAKKKLGKGTIFISRNLNTVVGREKNGYPKELLDVLYKAFIPFSISGNVETLFNRTPDGWAIMIINNNGITKPIAYPETEKIDLSKTQTVGISYSGTGGKISEAFGNKFKQDKNNGKTKISFDLKPGEISLYRIKY